MQESFTGDECTGLADLLSKASIDPATQSTAHNQSQQGPSSSMSKSPLSAARLGGGRGQAGISTGGGGRGGSRTGGGGGDMSFSCGEETPSTPRNDTGDRNISESGADRDSSQWFDEWDTVGGGSVMGGPPRGELDFSTPAIANGGRRQGGTGAMGEVGDGAGAGAGAGVEEDSFDALVGGGSFEYGMPPNLSR